MRHLGVFWGYKHSERSVQFFILICLQNRNINILDLYKIYRLFKYLQYLSLDSMAFTLTKQIKII